MGKQSNGSSTSIEDDSRHRCLIYEGAPSVQLPALAAVIYRKLEEGYRCFYLNSPPMVAGLRTLLAAKGLDVVSETSKARLILSSKPALAADGSFDVELMLYNIEYALDQALTAGYKGLFATGDMTWEFGPGKDFAKLLEYEWRLEKLFRKRQELSGICQYHLGTLPREVAREGLLSHRIAFINETLSRINPYYVSSGPLSGQMATNPQLDEMITTLCRCQDTKSSLKQVEPTGG